MPSDWPAQISALASVVTAGGLVAVVFQARIASKQLKTTEGQLRAVEEQQKLALRQELEIATARQDELLNERSQAWDDDHLLDARMLADQSASPEDLATKLIGLKETKERDFYVLLRLPNYFEDLAELVSRGRLPLETVEELLGSVIIGRYRQFEPAIRRLRQEQKQPTFCKYWEWLKDELPSSPAEVAQKSVGR